MDEDEDEDEVRGHMSALQQSPAVSIQLHSESTGHGPCSAASLCELSELAVWVSFP